MNTYQLEFEVRDSELDMQGVVNNANYYRYFEHARHKFLKQHGISFSEMSDNKQYLVLTSTTIEFKKSLKAEDKFYITCKIVRESKIRMAFAQEIRRIPDDVLIATSYSVGVCLDGKHGNKPYLPEAFLQFE